MPPGGRVALGVVGGVDLDAAWSPLEGGLGRLTASAALCREGVPACLVVGDSAGAVAPLGRSPPRGRPVFTAGEL